MASARLPFDPLPQAAATPANPGQSLHFVDGFAFAACEMSTDRKLCATSARSRRVRLTGEGPAMESGFVESDATLRDGRVVHLRAMRQADEAELLQAFDRMSPDARYMRFMRSVREPNRDRLRKALASFPDSGDGVVATVPAADGIDIVGSAIFVIAGNASTCEFAINVAAEYGAAGLGGTLMTALVDAAKRRGLAEMEGFVLAENRPMLRLAARHGFDIEPAPADRTVRICRLRLRGT
jgi:acetyltransferase